VTITASARRRVERGLSREQLGIGRRVADWRALRGLCSPTTGGGPADPAGSLLQVEQRPNTSFCRPRPMLVAGHPALVRHPDRRDSPCTKSGQPGRSRCSTPTDLHRCRASTAATTPRRAFVTWTSARPVRRRRSCTPRRVPRLLDRVLGPLRGRARNRPETRPSPNLIPLSLALNSGIYNALFGLRAGAALVIMDVHHR